MLAYNHGTHWSLTEHCTGSGYWCDRIFTKDEVREYGAIALAAFTQRLKP